MKIITVLLADDHAVFREGLRLLLMAAGDIEVVGEVENGHAAVRETLRLQPDVVLMDVAMPLLNGIDAARQIRSAAPQRKVLVLSTYSDERRIEAALDAGVAGYFTKSVAGADLCEAIRAIHRGESCFNAAVLKHLSKRWKTRRPDGRPRRPSNPTLSCRQSEVLQLVAEGFSSKEIAPMMGISPKTVEKHRQTLMDRLDIHEISTLTRYAVSNGVIELDITPLRASASATSIHPRRFPLAI